VTHYVPIRTAARRLGVHENTVRNWIDKGLMAARRLPSGVRQLPAREVMRMEEQLAILPIHGIAMDQEVKSPPKSVPGSGQERFGRLPTI
jgi:excisionase family DNA binding protein